MPNTNAGEQQSPAFADIKRQCNGMLPLDVYQRIYEEARQTTEGDVVEVGTAHGAATVCLALGLMATGRAARVHTIDRLEGGSRAQFGGFEDNRRILERNLHTFGVTDFVRVWAGDVREQSPLLPLDNGIGLLMLDADGQIDRDILGFSHRLMATSRIVIDDAKDLVRIDCRNGTVAGIDMKMKLTQELLDFFVRGECLSNGEKIGNTYFGRYTARREDLSRLAPGILDVYRGLIICQSPTIVMTKSRARMQQWRGRISRRFDAHPGAKRWIQRLLHGTRSASPG